MSDPGPERWQNTLNQLIFTLQRIGLAVGPVMVLDGAGPRQRPAAARRSPLSSSTATYMRSRDTPTRTGRATPGPQAGERLPEVAGRAVSNRRPSPDEARPVMRAWPANVAAAVGFSNGPGPAQDGTPDESKRWADRLTVFRLDPIGG